MKMSSKPLNLSEGVTYEVLDSKLIKDFEASQKEYTEGFVRLQPYNQVRLNKLNSVVTIIILHA